jgi:beta-xylosidase
MKYLQFVLFSSLLTLVPFAGRAAAQTTPLPAPRHDLRLTEIPIRDPWIVANASDRTYYLYASSKPGDVAGVDRAGVMIYKSKDLQIWDGPYAVFAIPDGIWADPQENPWAPEVHKYHGKYYLFLTLLTRTEAQPPLVWRPTKMRGTTIAVSDSLDGPFTLVKTDGPIPPANFVTLDGTLYVDPQGKPWMVYAHEWVQKIDGTMETVPLKPDLSAADGPPIFLFKGSDAPWLDGYLRPDTRELSYVTDGPELFRTKDNYLLMLWASFGPNGYIETVARSKSGQITGPWEQLPPLLEEDGGHGMLFYTFDGKLMLVLHQPNHDSHAKLFEMLDEGDRIVILRERFDLDGSRPME